MCVWLVISIQAIYGSQIENREFDLEFSLFGIHDSAIRYFYSMILTLLFLFGRCGRCAFGGEPGTVFLGIGSTGWTRRFDWKSIHTIREARSQVQYPGGQSESIILEGSSRMRFGSGLMPERRKFIVDTLSYLKAEERT